jgi:hypothetical protein
MSVRGRWPYRRSVSCTTTGWCTWTLNCPPCSFLCGVLILVHPCRSGVQGVHSPKVADSRGSCSVVHPNRGLDLCLLCTSPKDREAFLGIAQDFVNLVKRPMISELILITPLRGIRPNHFFETVAACLLHPREDQNAAAKNTCGKDCNKYFCLFRYLVASSEARDA